jgi:hypothetical protein
MPWERLTPKETQLATLVWEGLTHREIGKLMLPDGAGRQESLAQQFRQSLESARFWLCPWPAMVARLGWKTRGDSAGPLLRLATSTTAAKGLPSGAQTSFENSGKTLKNNDLFFFAVGLQIAMEDSTQ